MQGQLHQQQREIIELKELMKPLISGINELQEEEKKRKMKKELVKFQKEMKDFQEQMAQWKNWWEKELFRIIKKRQSWKWKTGMGTELDGLYEGQ